MTFKKSILRTFGMELLSMLRMVTTVRTEVTPSVTRAGGELRGNKKETQEITTINAQGPYTWTKK